MNKYDNERYSAKFKICQTDSQKSCVFHTAAKFCDFTVNSYKINTHAYHLPVSVHSTVWRFIPLITAIGPNKELCACNTTTNSSPSVISGVIVVFQCRNSFPSDSMLRNSIRSLYSLGLLTAVVYASFTEKCVKLVKFSCRHADLPSSETGGKYTSIMRSLSKSDEDFWIVRDKSKLQNNDMI